MQSWPYTERSRIDDLLERLAKLRATIAAMAKDEITPEERAQIAEAQRKKAEELNESLRKSVEEGKRK